MSAWSSRQADAAKRLVGAVRHNAANTLPGTLLHRMGYRTINARHLERLARVLGDDLLGLDAPCFDFKYTSARFAERLCEVLRIEDSLIEQGMVALRERVARRNGFVPYLFVDTSFRRSTQPIFVLALMEGHRRIGFSRVFRDLGRDAQVTAAGKKARAHYTACDGVLPVWGEVRRYCFHQAADRVVILNNEGAFVRVQVSSRSAAATLNHNRRSLCGSIIEDA